MSGGSQAGVQIVFRDAASGIRMSPAVSEAIASQRRQIPTRCPLSGLSFADLRLLGPPLVARLSRACPPRCLLPRRHALCCGFCVASLSAVTAADAATTRVTERQQSAGRKGGRRTREHTQHTAGRSASTHRVQQHAEPGRLQRDRSRSAARTKQASSRDEPDIATVMPSAVFYMRSSCRKRRAKLSFRPVSLAGRSLLVCGAAVCARCACLRVLCPSLFVPCPLLASLVHPPRRSRAARAERWMRRHSRCAVVCPPQTFDFTAPRSSDTRTPLDSTRRTAARELPLHHTPHKAAAMAQSRLNSLMHLAKKASGGGGGGAGAGGSGPRQGQKLETRTGPKPSGWMDSSAARGSNAHARSSSADLCECLLSLLHFVLVVSALTRHPRRREVVGRSGLGWIRRVPIGGHRAAWTQRSARAREQRSETEGGRVSGTR